jgi:hypothetical protein
LTQGAGVIVVARQHVQQAIEGSGEQTTPGFAVDRVYETLRQPGVETRSRTPDQVRVLQQAVGHGPMKGDASLLVPHPQIGRAFHLGGNCGAVPAPRDAAIPAERR